MKPLEASKHDAFLSELVERYHVPLKLPGYLVLVTGQSGAGKNFVCTLFQHLLMSFDREAEEKLKGQVLFYSSNGDGFRRFCSETSSLSRVAQIIEERKNRYQKQWAIMPFLFIFSKIQEKFKENDMVLINGSPRSEEEYLLWRSMLDTDEEPGLFKKILVINLQLSDKVAAVRLSRRDRADSNTIKKIQKKLLAYREGRLLFRRWEKKPLRYVPRKLAKRIELIHIDAEQDKRTTAFQFFDELYKFNTI